MSADYPWYEIVNGATVLQGDILEFFDILIPIESKVGQDNTIDSRIEKYDVIVLSQSCDLSNTKIDFVLLSPILSLENFAAQADGVFKGRKGWEQIRQGLIPGLHMLDECSVGKMNRPVRIVNFHKLFSMPIKYVKEIAEKKGDRIRLCPPYREHLSQSFARYFMRVGLPQDIARF